MLMCNRNYVSYEPVTSQKVACSQTAKNMGKINVLYAHGKFCGKVCTYIGERIREVIKVPLVDVHGILTKRNKLRNRTCYVCSTNLHW